jgi:hypothetical protein
MQSSSRTSSAQKAVQIRASVRISFPLESHRGLEDTPLIEICSFTSTVHLFPGYPGGETSSDRTHELLSDCIGPKKGEEGRGGEVYSSREVK